MTREKLQSKIVKQSLRVLNKYQSKVEMINTLSSIGVTKHECMILELVLLGKDFESIRRILLFTHDNYSELLIKLHTSLKEHDKNKRHFDKLRT